MAHIHHHAPFDSKYRLLYFFHVRTNLRPVPSPLVSPSLLLPPPPPLSLPSLFLVCLHVLKWVQGSVEGADSFDFLYIVLSQ